MISRIKSKLSKGRLLRSFRVRIFFIILLIGICPALIMRFGVLNNYEQRAVSVRQSDIQNQMKILSNHLITYNYLGDTTSDVSNAEVEQI